MSCSIKLNSTVWLVALLLPVLIFVVSLHPLKGLKDITGKPGTGFHSHRILGLASVDTIALSAVAIIFAFYFNWKISYTLIGMLLLSILVHEAFGVPTALMVWLGLM
jgi:hypothetical protein